MSAGPRCLAQGDAEARLALGASGLLAEFNRAAVLSAADVHVARRLSRLGDEAREDVLLAAALAVRATRLGSVFVDLATIAQTAAIEDEEPAPPDEAAQPGDRRRPEDLPWPEPAEWTARVWASPLVERVEDTQPGSAPSQRAEPTAPLQLEESRLYLSRLWQDELAVAQELLRRGAMAGADIDPGRLEAGLARLFPHLEDGDQRRAASVSVRRRLSVIAGGPGTGKTATVARLVALLVDQDLGRGQAPPLVALAAPTGKAAARLQEEVVDAAASLDVSPEVRRQLEMLQASTLHRLLGRRPDSRTRFRHDRLNRLPHDVVIIDETSMVPLPMMARVLEAVRPDARLVLVGDPGQLASVEAGTVLGDIVAAGEAGSSDRSPGFGAGITLLERVHRYGGAIGRVADAIRRGDADALLAELRTDAEEVHWLDADFADEHNAAELVPLRRQTVDAATELHRAAVAGDGRRALAAMRGSMVLCAHRRGPYGVSGVSARLLEWLRAGIPDLAAHRPTFVGQPLLVTENDYELRLYNGDTGVVVQEQESRLTAVFQRGEELLPFTPTRLASVQTVYAMTIHKSQGSQFRTVSVILPGPASRILTRELLYTAATRATERLVLVGTKEMVRAAVDRPLTRASGLRERLWS